METPSLTKLATEMARRHGTPITLKGLHDAAQRLSQPDEKREGFTPRLVSLTTQHNGKTYHRFVVEDAHTLTLLHAKAEQAGLMLVESILSTPREAAAFMDQLAEIV